LVGCSYCKSDKVCQPKDEVCQECGGLSQTACLKHKNGCCWSNKDEACYFSDENDCSDGLDMMTIIYIAVGAGVGLILIISLSITIACCCKKKNSDGIEMTAPGTIVVLPEGQPSMVAAPESMQSVTTLDPQATVSIDATGAPSGVVPQSPTGQLTSSVSMTDLLQQQQLLNSMMAQQQMSMMMNPMNPMMMNPMSMGGMGSMNGMGMGGMPMNSMGMDMSSLAMTGGMSGVGMPTSMAQTGGMASMGMTAGMTAGVTAGMTAGTTAAAATRTTVFLRGEITEFIPVIIRRYAYMFQLTIAIVKDIITALRLLLSKECHLFQRRASHER